MASFRILVKDVDSAVQTYGFLGFEVVDRFEPFASMRRGDMTLWISGPKASASRTLSDGTQPVPGGWNRPVIEVDNLQSFRAELESKGIRIRNDVITGPGGSQMLIEDGQGNVVEIFEHRK